MDTPPEILPTWCQKLNETTEIILEKEDTTWKIWTTATRNKNGFSRFNFIVKQLTGPTKSAIFTIYTDKKQFQPNSWHSPCELSYSNFTKAAEYQLRSPWVNKGYQFIISVDFVVNKAHRVKPVEEWTDQDYLMTIGDKKFAIHKSISEKLGRKFAGGAHRHEVELVGVDYNDFITLIDNPESIDNDLTDDKCHRFHIMQRKYGIRHNSEKIEKRMEVDFWGDCDDIKYHVYEWNYPRKSAPEVMISKKYRMLSLPSQFTINAFDMTLDVYFYTQEYNGTSYVSIGVISGISDISDMADQPTDNNDDDSKCRNGTICLNIQLHHPTNPLLHKSVYITRDFNNQRSAGCPIFMLSSELGDYCRKDGSYLVSFNLSPTDNTSDLPYPGIKDVVLSCDNQNFNVSRDLLLHHCPSFGKSTNSDIISADNISIDMLLILLDLIYHRSNARPIDNIHNALIIFKNIECQYAYDHLDRVLASQYRNQQDIDITELYDSMDLPLLREAERLGIRETGTSMYPHHHRTVGYPSAYPYPSELPSGVRIVRPLTVNRLLDIILPLKVFNNKNERSRLCGQLNSENGLLKLRQYRMALCTLEGVPQELRMDLQDAYHEIREGQDEQAQSVGDGLEAFEKLLGDGGFKELKEKAKKERKIVQDAMSELVVLKNRGRTSRRTKSFIEEIVARDEEDCREGRRQAAKMFVEKLRKEEGSGKEEKKEDGTTTDEIRMWAQYLGTLATLQF